MTKVVRITTVITAILVVVFFVFPVVFGASTEEKADIPSNSPGIIEKFKKSRAKKPKAAEDQKPPIVKQAEAFALYLNPPPPVKKINKTPDSPSRTKSVRKADPMGPVSAKFNVIATSYYALRPQLSFALIDEPGSGRRWVKPSEKIGHLIIEQIKEGVVVVKDGERSFDVYAEIKPTKSLLKSDQSSLLAPVTSTNLAALNTTGTRNNNTPSRRRTEGPVDKKKAAMMDNFVENLRAVKAGENGPNSKEVLMKNFVSRLQGSSVSSKEANNLTRLGQRLKEAKKDPNKPKGKNTK